MSSKIPSLQNYQFPDLYSLHQYGGTSQKSPTHALFNHHLFKDRNTKGEVYGTKNLVQNSSWLLFSLQISIRFLIGRQRNKNNSGFRFSTTHTQKKNMSKVFINKKAPNFSAKAVVNGEFKTVTLDDFKGTVNNVNRLTHD